LRARPWLATALLLAALCGVWQLVVAAHVLPFWSLPSPLAVAVRLGELARSGVLAASIAASLSRMVIGFAAAVLLGIATGCAMGLSAVVRDALRSLFLGLQTLPSAAWAPIALLLFGLSDTAIVFVVVACSFPAVAIATADAITRIPPTLLRAARTLGTPPTAMVTRVVLPAAMPGVVTGLKLGWTLGWHGVVSAELIRSTVGLGFLLHAGRELADAAQVIGVMLVTVALGLLLDRLLFAHVERRIHARWGLGRP
jgi:NitT/TauT family transport system permease protein